MPAATTALIACSVAAGRRGGGRRPGLGPARRAPVARRGARRRRRRRDRERPARPPAQPASRWCWTLLGLGRPRRRLAAPGPADRSRWSDGPDGSPGRRRRGRRRRVGAVRRARSRFPRQDQRVDRRSRGWRSWSRASVGPLLLLALIARHGPTRGTSLLFMVPAVTALIAWVLLGEPVGVVARARPGHRRARPVARTASYADSGRDAGPALRSRRPAVPRRRPSSRADELGSDAWT